MRYRVEEYLPENGSSPYRQCFMGLDPIAAAKVSTAKVRMELGNLSSVKWFRGIGEYIIDWGLGYRIYLAKDGDSVIILFGGSTKRQQQKAIEKAIGLFEEYKIRKKRQTQPGRK